MSEGSAIHHGTLESFFFEEIERAQERCGQSLSDEAEAYVVGLLARFARRTQVRLDWHGPDQSAVSEGRASAHPRRMSPRASR